MNSTTTPTAAQPAAVPPRTFTPNREETGPDGRTSGVMTLKRACNGCGHLLGDLEDRDADDDGNLTDVRGECPNCSSLVALEQAGCTTWRVTERTFSTVEHQIDQLKPWVFTKGYWKFVDGKLQVVGLRVGADYTDRVVAFFGDWLIRHPDGRFSVHAHKAPAQDVQDGGTTV